MRTTYSRKKDIAYKLYPRSHRLKYIRYNERVIEEIIELDPSSIDPGGFVVLSRTKDVLIASLNGENITLSLSRKGMGLPNLLRLI